MIPEDLHLAISGEHIPVGHLQSHPLVVVEDSNFRHRTPPLCSTRLKAWPRADCILLYGIQPRHWSPPEPALTEVGTGMTVKRSFPQERESRSRTCHGKPL